MDANNNKRPTLVWVISIYYFISAGYTLLSWYLFYTGKSSLKPAEKAYFDSLSSFDHFITIVMMSVTLLGAISLFFLRKPALYLFSGALCTAFLLTILHILNNGWATVFGGLGLVSLAVGWGMALAVILYTKKLIKNGLLN